MAARSEALSRHALAWIDPAAWNAELSGRQDLAAEPLVACWVSRSWPLVARRRCASDPGGRVALGLPLPPSHGKKRVAVDLPPAALLSVHPALLLTKLDPPKVWRPTIHALLALADEFDVEARVFGSFAWARLTGLDYVTPGSDLDLLWPLTPRTADLLPRLATLERDAPGRLDGEVVDGLGSAANWRELLGHSPEILVKTLDGVAIISRACFLGTTGIAA